VSVRGRQFATILIALVAGLVGALVGARMIDRAPVPPLHALVHHDLDLTSAQRARVDVLERDYAARRQALEAEMRAANADLAGAIREERGYGPKVTAAVDRFHGAMGRLQKATIEHVFAMRTVLTPAQAKRFDQSVVKALTADAA